jgi:hypothetical protein
MKFTFNGVAKRQNKGEVNWNATMEISPEDVQSMFNSEGDFPMLVKEILAIVKDEEEFSHDREEARDDRDTEIAGLKKELREARDKACNDHRELFNENMNLKDILIDNGINFETGKPYGSIDEDDTKEEDDPEIPDPTKDEKETEW